MRVSDPKPLRFVVRPSLQQVRHKGNQVRRAVDKFSMTVNQEKGRFN